VGDALGVPVETRTHEYIMELTGGRGVTGYLDPKMSRFDDMHGQPIGGWSDDTQLSLITAQSLIIRGGYDIVNQGVNLVHAMETTQMGWGGTTREAVKEIQLWLDSDEPGVGRHPSVPAKPAPPDKPGFGEGSAPAMKIFPLAAWDLLHARTEDVQNLFLYHAMELGMMTHGDTRASIASVALGQAIAAFANFATPSCEDCDPGFASAHRMRELRGQLTGHTLQLTEAAEKAYAREGEKRPRFSEKLQEAIAWIDYPAQLRERINTGFRAIESVPFAIATACRHPEDFRTAVLEAVNAGRDTDTVGSMVGAMIGARVGLEGIPMEWQTGLHKAEEVMQTADELCAAAFGRTMSAFRKAVPAWKQPA